MNDKVSIIIPTYKQAKLLPNSIRSALNQTYSNIEIIVIDDNEPFSEERKLSEIAMKEFSDNSKVIYVKHEKNKNGAAARNTGISISSGEYIAFLDDDDQFLPEKIELQVKYLLENKEYQGVYCGSIIRGKNVIPSLKGNLSKELLLINTNLYTPTLLFYREIVIDLNGFNESFSRHQDYEFMLRYFEKYDIGLVEQALVKIGDNEGFNHLKGKNLEQTKMMFFNLFEHTINKLELSNKGFKNKLYAKHYSIVFLNHIQNKDLILSLNILLNYFTKYPILFIKYSTQRFMLWLKYKNYKNKNK